MKQLLAISFLCIYFLALLNPISPFINYSLNKTEIIDKYCENKDQPILACEGKCHLKKQIEKKSKEQDQNDEVSKTEILSPVGRVANLYVKEINFYKNQNTIPSFNERLKNLRSIQIDYPPQWV